MNDGDAAEYAKLPLIPPYLQPHIADFSNGVNFASGGAGVLSTTHSGLVWASAFSSPYYRYAYIYIVSNPFLYMLYISVDLHC